MKTNPIATSRLLTPRSKGWITFVAAALNTVLVYCINMAWAYRDEGYLWRSLGSEPQAAPYLGYVTMIVYLSMSFLFSAHIATRAQYLFATIWWKLSVLPPILIVICILLWNHPLSTVLGWFIRLYYTPYAGYYERGAQATSIIPLAACVFAIWNCAVAKYAYRKHKTLSNISNKP